MLRNRPYTIGITGGIGSGKSVVSQLLCLMGIPVYGCDIEAKRLMSQSEEIRAELVRIVGDKVYGSDGQLDRNYLAAYMFGNANHVAQINRIVHPCVRADFRQWVEQADKDVVAVESAILFEAGMDADVDAVWVVSAPKEIRLQRAVLRDKASEESIRRRMRNQCSDAEYRERADVTIYNDGIHSLISQVRECLAPLGEL